MPIILSCLSGIAVLALLVISGGMAASDLAHPFWVQKASVIGAVAGGTLSAALLWLVARKPGMKSAVTSGVALALIAIVLMTWRAARKFIDSADFEPVAGKLWYLGYHMLAALIVAFAALLVIRFFQREPR